MSITMPKKRGRPSKADIAAREAAKEMYAQKHNRSDAEILEDLTERFNMLHLLTVGAHQQNIRALVASGAPGVGKTFTVEKELEEAGAEFEIVKGGISAVNLYKLAWRMRHPGAVIVLDDADGIFHDEEALNILKALCDSGTTRKVSWMKESAALREDDIPQSFEFRGAMIFISNLDFQRFVDEGRNKYATHFEALMSRSLYLDLRLHDRQSLAVWIKHVAVQGRIFAREGVSKEIGDQILSFLDTRREDLRELSLRTLMKCCQLANAHPTRWQNMARMLLCR